MHASLEILGLASSWRDGALGSGGPLELDFPFGFGRLFNFFS